MDKEEKKKAKKAKKALKKAKRREWFKKNWPMIVTVIGIVVLAVLTFKIVNFSLVIDTEINRNGVAAGSPAQAPAVQAPSAAPQTTAPAAPATAAPAAQGEEKPSGEASASSGALPQTTEEIVKKYCDVLNKMKQDQPGYTKKEYQALPEEYRQFSNVVNSLLKFGESYMTKEDSENAIVTSQKGEVFTGDDGVSQPRINHELPICNTDKGCVLTDCSGVKEATCTENADGTVTLRFVLNDEVNPEPTPASTGVPVSFHGAVMMPASRADIMTEIEKVEKLAGATCNNFTLTYRDCSFECKYNPSNDQVVSITHHANIDIDADVKILFSNIVGSARLTNDMFVYDVIY